MTPMRWLRVIGCVAVLYVFGILVTALDGVWNVPQQLNSVILTAFASAAIIAARAERDRRAEARLQLETAERDASFHAKLDEVRRNVCWMEATAQPVLAAEVIGETSTQRITGTAAVPGEYASRDRVAEVWTLTEKLNRHLRPAAPADGA